MQSIKKIIDIVKKKNHQDHDTLFVIVGDEGSGKSNLMLHILEEYNKEADIRDVAFNKEEFVRVLKNMKRFGNPVFDEAGDGMYSRDAMVGLNKLLIKTYMAIRGYNLFTILVLPNFFDLDSFFRQHRVKGLFQVYKRGSFKFWNKNQIYYINQSSEKKIKIKPSVYDTFPKYKGRLKEEYDIKKTERIKQALNNITGNNNILEDMPKTHLVRKLMMKPFCFLPKDLIKQFYFKTIPSEIYEIYKELKDKELIK
jgi:ABC-type dipeptide/oligopeptide/nickel transport system ATPase component